MSNKIIRTICQFTDDPSPDTVVRLRNLEEKLSAAEYLVQTIRVTTNNPNFVEVREKLMDDNVLVSLGDLSLETARGLFPGYHSAHNTSFNIELSAIEVTMDYVDVLFDIIRHSPANTFNFTYLFNGLPTPYFPSAVYRENGFAVGLQPTDLAEGCTTLMEWLSVLKETWTEVANLLADEPGFLGIDSSIAPLFEGKSSLVNFIKRLGMTFPQSTTTDTYTTISNWIKTENPKSYGLNGLMMPCLEDFELADEYEKGEFSLERNIYLSLHSGLGIDTYPIGIDEKPERVLEVLKLMQALSNKYRKPLSTRFVSDGKAKIGERTDFQNEYLKDVVIRSL